MLQSPFSARPTIYIYEHTPGDDKLGEVQSDEKPYIDMPPWVPHIYKSELYYMGIEIWFMNLYIKNCYKF